MTGWLGTLLALPTLAVSQVKIGVINSMTGPQAPIGENLTNGIKLAEEDLAAKGIKVQLVWEDDTGKPQISMSAMEKLAGEGVAGVVGFAVLFRGVGVRPGHCDIGSGQHNAVVERIVRCRRRSGGQWLNPPFRRRP